MSAILDRQPACLSRGLRCGSPIIRLPHIGNGPNRAIFARHPISCGDPLGRSPQCLLHSLRIKRFDDVVHRMQIKGFASKFVVGCCKNNRWQPICLRSLDSLKPGQPRHLNIHQDNVKMILVHRTDGLSAIFAHTRNGKPGHLADNRRKQISAELLIVHQ